MSSNVCLYFIDEAGNTGRDLENSEQPFHYLVALEIPADQTWEIQQNIREIAISLFPQTALDYSFEFHGYDLFAGEGAFKGTKPAVRIDAYQQLLNILPLFKLKYWTVMIDKRRLKARYASPWHPHNIAFRLLLEYIEIRLQKTDGVGLLIADEERDRSHDLIDDLESFRRSGTGMGPSGFHIVIEHILDTIHFVPSHHSWLVQLVDVVTYVMQRAMKNKRENLTGKSAEAINDLFTTIEGHEVARQVFPK